MGDEIPGRGAGRGERGLGRGGGGGWGGGGRGAGGGGGVSWGKRLPVPTPYCHHQTVNCKFGSDVSRYAVFIITGCVCGRGGVWEGRERRGDGVERGGSLGARLPVPIRRTAITRMIVHCKLGSDVSHYNVFIITCCRLCGGGG